MSFLALLERGNERDVEAWSEQLIAKCGKQIVKIGAKSMQLTCTVGLSVVTPSGANLDATIADAVDACRKGRGRGGNQAVTSDKADNDARVKSYDAVWVKHIKAALMENRFRLVQQPVASLQGDDLGMFDVLVRMIDGGGKEVLPSEFMAAAERNDLLKNIDRWVVGASLSFAAQRKPGCLFVRLSKDTVRDASFLDWLDNQLRASRGEPSRLCFQIPESMAASQITEATNLAGKLRTRGFKFAMDAFGSGRDPLGLLNSHAARLHQDRRRDRAEPRLRSGCAEEGEDLRRGSGQAQGSDHCGTRGECEHDGCAVAAGRGVHPGLSHQRPGRSRAARRALIA